ncbi:MAG: lactate utilization protein B/C [Citrobacter freundii]|nr:MAG: lactate utilization protein B/C [Citrobacter freundii]
MSSRNNILNRVKQAQPSLIPLPADLPLEGEMGKLDQFKQILESIGGRVVMLNKEDGLLHQLREIFPSAARVVSSIQSLEAFFLRDHQELSHHSLEDVDIAIIEAKFGVAENGAIWVTEEDINIRVLPFIAENLVVILDHKDLVPTMHHAYQRIAYDAYGFGVFIAGPSKTADIEQSLVLGAHGPKTMTILVRG